MTKYITILTIMLLGGCATQPTEIVTKEVPVEKIPLDLSMPEPFEWKDFEVIIITKDNFDDVMEKLEKSGKALSLFAFDEDGYKSLTLNVNEMKRYMADQKLVIIQYKNYYEKQ